MLLMWHLPSLSTAVLLAVSVPFTCMKRTPRMREYIVIGASHPFITEDARPSRQRAVVRSVVASLQSIKREHDKASQNFARSIFASSRRAKGPPLNFSGKRNPCFKNISRKLKFVAVEAARCTSCRQELCGETEKSQDKPAMLDARDNPLWASC